MIADGGADAGDGAQAAADWVVRLSGEACGEADWLAFTAWLDSAPADRPDLHREAFDRAQAVWLAADQLAGVGAAGARRPPRRTPARTLRQVRALRSAAAAVAACLVAGGAWLVARPPAERGGDTPRLATFATSPGQTRALRLPDGSRITLDGASALTVEAFEPQGRAVALQRGEAMFDVVHDAARPFRVDLGPASVQVLGTAFDVVREAEATRVSVSRGAVRFAFANADVRVGMGRSAELAGGRLAVRPVAPGEVGGWREGRRLYRDRPLAEVVSDLNRGFAHPVEIGDAAARRMRFTGVLVLGPRETMVRRLATLLPLQARPGADGVVVLSTRGP